MGGGGRREGGRGSGREGLTYFHPDVDVNTVIGHRRRPKDLELGLRLGSMSVSAI